MNKKVILSSILTLVLCVSFIIGGTFALFTSTHETNIAVTSGKVDVVATIENLKLYSPELINADGSYDDKVNVATTAEDKKSGVFVNGGTATLNGAVLTLDKVTPGDMVTFQIKITNNSNVKTQYRTVVKVIDDNGLCAGLDMMIDGASYNGNAQYTDWTPLEVVEAVDLIECSVALPTIGENQNQYQGKTCKIVYIVEAVQGNAATDNNVAEFDGTGYATFEGALAAAEAADNGGTVKITRPGTYAPFTITKTGITVEGIVGANKGESTVIKTTATENIDAFADDVTLKNLYIDATTPMTFTNAADQIQNGGAINSYVHADSSSHTNNLTVEGCYLEGNSAMSAFYYLGGDFTLTGSTVDGFERVNQYDNGKAGTHTITGNTFKNLSREGMIYAVDGTNTLALTIQNNKFETPTMLSINDNGTNALAALNISGNTGAGVIYRLSFFENACGSVTAGADQKIMYTNYIKFEGTDEQIASAKIVSADGSLICNEVGYDNINAAASVWLSAGSYKLVDKNTNDLIKVFDVTEPNGKEQVVELPTVTLIATPEELKNILTNVSGAQGDATITLTNDIQLNGDWTPVVVEGYTGTGKIIINGNGHTISGLTAPLFAGGFAGTSGIIIENLTISNSDIVSTNTLGSGAFIETIDSMETITLTNCHLLNSTLSGSRTGGLIGWNSGYDDENNGAVNTIVNIKDCSVIGCEITGAGTVGGIIGHAGANPATYNTITNCKVENTKLTSNDNTYRVGNIIGTANIGHVIISNCSYSGNTLVQNNNGAIIERPAGQSDAYGRTSFGTTGTLTIDGQSIK